ncbi:ATP-binding protein [Blastococcus deserti]|uniref:ATP-binding protein n=1 Tax=Blastococcus deserti TaxID=2259033 RepID=A0ABW4XG83_9ACTN
MEARLSTRRPAPRRLVGRRVALLALERAVEDAVAGHGGLVMLTGDPGIGKTALATVAADQAAHRAARVAWGTCWDGEGAPGFWPWIQVLRDLGSGARLLEDGPVEHTDGTPVRDEQAERFRLFDAVAQHLDVAARDRPLMVVLDDLHWADASSVRLLAFLARRLRALPVLVVGTYRDLDVAAPGHPLHQLLPPLAEQARLLPLTGLEPADVSALARTLLGTDVPDDLVADLHRRSGGNPFLVEQLTSLLESGSASDLPPVLGDVVARRLDRLPAPTRRLLDAAAVVGTEFDVDVAATAAGLRAEPALDVVHEAERARVVTAAAPGRARFGHDLFREVLYARLPARQRCALHLAVAEELERQRAAGRPVPPQEPAHHRAAALPLGDPERAVAALLEAGRDATGRRAFDEAVNYHRRATDLHPSPPPAQLVEYAHALRRAGRPDAAYDRFLAAAERARDEGDAGVLAAAALGAHRVATATDVVHADVVALLEEALAHDDVPVDRCLLLAALARELADGPARDEPRADALAREAIRAAQHLGDTSVLAHALWAQLDVRWRPGTARERLPLTDELEEVARRADEQELVLEAWFTRMVALLELADPAWSGALDEFVRLADELRVPHFRYLALSRRASRACLTGPVERADALIGEAIEYGEHVGEPDAWGVGSSQWVGLGLLRGDWSRLMGIAEERGRPLAPPGFAFVLRAFLHLERGETAAAAALVAGLGRPDELGYRWRRTASFALLAELAAALGDQESSARWYDELLPEGDTVGVLGGAVFTTGPVALQLGLLAATLGRTDEAIAHLERATELADRIAARLHAVRCRVELAAVLAHGTGIQRDRARPLLGVAAEEADRLGLDRLGERARQLLTGLDRPPENVFRRDGDVWDLTYAGRTVRLRDAKGLQDLARLLAAPGREIPAADLLGAPHLATVGADPVLDDRARTAYRQRIAELDARLAEADAAGDARRGARLTEERAAVVHELVAASGLGGRRRRLGDAGERARSTVTARIRDALRHIEQAHPELGGHLRTSVATGTRCSYRPTEAVHWRL